MHFAVMTLVFILACGGTPPQSVKPASPTPSVPGGPDYPHAAADVLASNVATSYGQMTYVTYEPSSPRPTDAPVLVFLMGNWTPSPASETHLLYSAFYTHLARKGYVVIHPDNRFMSSDLLPAGTTVDDDDNIVAEIIRDALARQLSPGRMMPASDSQGVLLALGGHSWGGMLAQLIANNASQLNVPNPRALLLIDSTDRGIVSPNPNPLDPGNITLPQAWERIYRPQPGSCTSVPLIP